MKTPEEWANQHYDMPREDFARAIQRDAIESAAKAADECDTCDCGVCGAGTAIRDLMPREVTGND